jgi:hypothetical protein
MLCMSPVGRVKSHGKLTTTGFNDIIILNCNVFLILSLIYHSQKEKKILTRLGMACTSYLYSMSLI